MITDIDIQKITQALQGIFATKDDLKSFATKNDLKSFATKDDLSMLEEKMEKKFEMYTTIITKEVNNTVTIFCEKWMNY